MVREYLLVGLGNPGQTYLRTRHNIGFLLLERMLQRFSAAQPQQNDTYRCWTIQTEAWHCHLMQPLTFMNLSGNAVAPFVAQRNLPLDRVLVAFDDVALPLGRLRLKAKGSDGGHNGLGHLIATFDTNRISRLRLGVGNPELKHMSLVDFVLGTFGFHEWEKLPVILDAACDAVQSWLDHGLTATMAQFNGLSIFETSEDSSP